MWGELLAILAIIFLGSLAWSAISNWIERNRTPSSHCAELIRERLKDGRYRVVAGIFDGARHQETSQAWVVDKIDDDLERQFGGRDRAVIKF